MVSCRPSKDGPTSKIAVETMKRKSVELPRFLFPRYPANYAAGTDACDKHIDSDMPQKNWIEQMTQSSIGTAGWRKREAIWQDARLFFSVVLTELLT